MINKSFVLAVAMMAALVTTPAVHAAGPANQFTLMSTAACTNLDVCTTARQSRLPNVTVAQRSKCRRKWKRVCKRVHHFLRCKFVLVRNNCLTAK